jgi:hypothetical protein
VTAKRANARLSDGLQLIGWLFPTLCRNFGLKTAGLCAIEGNALFGTLAAQLLVVRIADTPRTM